MRKRRAAFSLSCSQNYFHLHALLHSINVPGRAFVESDYASAMPLKLGPNSPSCARASANFVHETQASSKLRFVAHMTPPWLYGVFRRDSIQNRQCLLASVQIASCISYLGLLRTEYRSGERKIPTRMLLLPNPTHNDASRHELDFRIVPNGHL